MILLSSVSVCMITHWPKIIVITIIIYSAYSSFVRFNIQGTGLGDATQGLIFWTGSLILNMALTCPQYGCYVYDRSAHGLQWAVWVMFRDMEFGRFLSCHSRLVDCKVIMFINLAYCIKSEVPPAVLVYNIDLYLFHYSPLIVLISEQLFWQFYAPYLSLTQPPSLSDQFWHCWRLLCTFKSRIIPDSVISLSNFTTVITLNSVISVI